MDNDVNEFLKRLGMEREKSTKWREIIKPSTVSIILGRKGMGKSALGYWLCEEMAGHYGLLPVVINLPRERQNLLPESFVIRQLGDVPRISDAVVIIDEGTTMLPAGKAKLEDMVKGYVALSRQRNQIILFVFHSSADVGSRILRGVDAILLKEPSQRQIQHGAKDNWWRALLSEAKEKFEALADMEAEPRAYTFVDSEEPEFRGMLQNPLPSFWSDELSKAWAGVDTLSEPQLELFRPPSLEYGRKVVAWHADDADMRLCYVVTPQMEREAIVVEEHQFDQSCYLIMEHPPTRLRWVRQVY
ncbi:MAG: hypothetical protein JRD89_10550 [Deltaproteobacteria bacterium]|nr:hypothetical protein [Deltaproteobacteria bacterium]